MGPAAGPTPSPTPLVRPSPPPPVVRAPPPPPVGARRPPPVVRRSPPPPPVQGTCQPSGSLLATQTGNFPYACVVGQRYPTYSCSPPVTSTTSAILTLNGFEQGETGGDASSCTGQFHRNTELVVALSTGWFNNRNRCTNRSGRYANECEHDLFRSTTFCRTISCLWKACHD